MGAGLVVATLRLQREAGPMDSGMGPNVVFVQAVD